MLGKNTVTKGILAAVTAVMALVTGQTRAADEPALEEVVVTGSKILRAAEAEALPLRVVTSADLLKQGAP
ncbi:MAG: hypothetical protein FGM43_12630, partial [Sinobacteraceae bacterium]|nr:hypothetical protein [Nevskiaceae bacterium]